MPLTNQSLYKLTQNCTPAPDFIDPISAATLQILVAAWLDFLNQQPTEAIIIVNFPPQQWLEAIDNYLQQQETDTVYLCSPQPRDLAQFEHLNKKAHFVKTKPQVQSQEHFLIILSPQLWGLLVAQPANTTASSSLQAAISFDPSIIKKMVTAIGKNLLVNPATNPFTQLLIEQDFPAENQLARLLIKQIEHTEATWQKLSQQTEEKITTTEASLEFKDQFLAQIARELRPPLTNMKTALRLLESKQSKREQRQRYLELLQRECDRQNSLIAGLLELVQLESTPENTTSSINLQDFLPGIVSTYQPLANEKGISLGYTIPKDLSPVDCQSNWLRQIIINLLSNSLKFTPSKGRVSVQARQQQNRVELSVSDTGIGIENSELPRIFDSFYRGRNAGSEAGTGLGLTIVKQLLRRCKGSITVASQPNKGSIFKVLLPIAKKAAP